MASPFPRCIQKKSYLARTGIIEVFKKENEKNHSFKFDYEIESESDDELFQQIHSNMFDIYHEGIDDGKLLDHILYKMIMCSIVLGEIKFRCIDGTIDSEHDSENAANYRPNPDVTIEDYDGSDDDDDDGDDSNDFAGEKSVDEGSKSVSIHSEAYSSGVQDKQGFSCRDGNQSHTIQCNPTNCRDMHKVFLSNMQYAGACEDSVAIEDGADRVKRSRSSVEMKDFALQLSPYELMKISLYLVCECLIINSQY